MYKNRNIKYKMGNIFCCCDKNKGKTNKQNPQKRITLAVVGDVGVGKTTLTKCFVSEEDQSNQQRTATTAFDQASKKIWENSLEVIVRDVAGS